MLMAMCETLLLMLSYLYDDLFEVIYKSNKQECITTRTNNFSWKIMDCGCMTAPELI